METESLNIALLVLRVVVGGVMFAHGYNHIFRGGKIDGTAGWFESLGMRPGKLHAWLASLAEVGGGLCLILGVLTPLGAAAVIGTMSVALVTNHLKNGFFIFNEGEGWEYVATLVACGVAIAALGAGEWSLDHALEIFESPRDGLLIGLIGGFGGAAALLVGFWRPADKS